jgi:RNA polymerase sigma-70 factor (ECF subfamily)
MDTDAMARIMARPAARANDPPRGSPTDSASDSFEAFYTGSVDRVYRGLAMTLADVHLAREATDEAMARAFAHWRRVVRYDNPAGWAFRVGLNWATSWRRKLHRESATLPDGAEPWVPGPEPGGSAVTAALDRLPVNQRAVVVCRVLFDLSIAETAAVLRIAEGTVRSRLSRAIHALRTDLRHTHHEEDQ